ncbi:MAG TPA: S8 family peptidase [Actinopolymorphaceae bacterium]
MGSVRSGPSPTWKQAVAVPAVTLLALAGLQTTANAGAGGEVAPLLGASAKDAVEGEYIVVFDEGVSTKKSRALQAAARAQGANVKFTYSSAIQGFASTLSKDALAAVRADPDVKYVEANRKIFLDATQSPATWGIDRIDQRELPLSNSYTYDRTGDGVKAYILDTGIRFSHQDFGGRAVSGFDAIDGGSADDCHGHGTHVAGTVGSETYGVAKGVQLVGVRVLDCQGSGTNAQVIAGIDWVTSDHDAGAPAVANMSLGGGVSQALDDAVGRSIADGVTYALAAGNDYGSDACNGSPGRVGAAVTVGSTTSSDARSNFSNIGSCLDIFAPGSDITSTSNASDTATTEMSGTSMATPHAAGAAALVLEQDPSATPQQVRDTLVSTATPDVVDDAGVGSPNLLLSTLGESDGGDEPPAGCAALPEQHDGTLSGTGASRYAPEASGWSAEAGTFQACLEGPSGTDFDLYLQKRSASGSWSTVARGISPDSTEEVTYQGTAGTYRWRVYSYSGDGEYAFGMNRP